MLDLRLVPAALMAWGVTAAGIAWRIGPLIAVICLAAAAGWWMSRRRLGDAYPALRAAGMGVLGVAVVGAGFGAAVALRNQAVDRHPIGQLFGRTAWVTVTPEESPRVVGSGRLMFRAALVRIADDETTGHVVVFASGVDFEIGRAHV